MKLMEYQTSRGGRCKFQEWVFQKNTKKSDFQISNVNKTEIEIILKSLNMPLKKLIEIYENAIFSSSNFLTFW